jgi:hypothetical protein
MTDETNFTILANANAKAYVITGALGATKSTTEPTPAPKFTAKLKHVAMGYWSDAQQSLIFLLVSDDDVLHCWSQSGGDTVTQKIPNAAIAQATGHVSTDGSLHVYAVDKGLVLWALHQSARKPWRDDGTPNWAPIIPLGKHVGRLVSDMNPAAAPSLFVVHSGDASLRLHAQDASSRMWKKQKILHHKPQAYEVTRHRAEIRVTDKKNARALPNHEVTVTVEKGSSAVEVWAGGQLHLVDEKGVTLTTDLTGKLTVAIIATEHGLACPNLVVNCDGLSGPQIVRPAGGVHEYLSGKGTLNPTNPKNRGGGPLPQFDAKGQTLKTATLNGQLFAPGATDSKDPDAAANVSAAIRHGASVALDKPPPGVAGFGGELQKGQTSFHAFHTEEAMRAHLEKYRLTQAQLGDFWDDLKHFFADIFEGIKNLVIKIVHFVVDVARKIVQFTLDFVGAIGKALHLDISGIEKAASFMHGFFNSVDAGIDEVVKWLEALFDFGAIWRTKMAIQKTVEGLCPHLVDLAGQAQKVADGWFADQKTAINTAFDAAIKKYAGQTYGQQANWQDPCAPASSTPIAGTKATPSDFTDNPHHNWLRDKATSYPPDTSGLTLDASIDKLWQDVAAHFADSASEFHQALEHFKNAIWTTISDPASFATKAIPEFIEMVRDLALAALDLMDTLVDAVAALIATGVDLVDKLLKAELPLGFLNTLWGWMAEAAGYKDDATLNMYSLGALLAALPATLIYKLAVGVEHEPFPEGKVPAPLADSAAQVGSTMAWESVLTSDIIRILQVFPAGIIDGMASESPWWLAVTNMIWGTAVFGLRHGVPTTLKELGPALVLSCSFIRPAVRIIINCSGKERQNISNDAAAGVGTVYGLGALAYGIYLDKTQKQRLGLEIANILVPLSNVFAWLTLSPIRKNPDFAPFAIAGNAAFDIIGYCGGGGELMADTIQWRPKHLVASE